MAKKKTKSKSTAKKDIGSSSNSTCVETETVPIVSLNTQTTTAATTTTPISSSSTTKSSNSIQQPTRTIFIQQQFQQEQEQKSNKSNDNNDDDEIIVSPIRVLGLGGLLLGIGTTGFYTIPGMIADNAHGSKLVNSFYCASVTLMTIGYGDICPGDMTLYGKLFLVLFVLCGMGMFCGPVMEITSSWRTQVPEGSIVLLSIVILGIGVLIFTSIEGISNTDALYASIITGTTIGYGDLTPKSNIGKIAVALYGVVGINVIAILLKPARDFFESFCHIKKQQQKIAPTIISSDATSSSAKKID